MVVCLGYCILAYAPSSFVLDNDIIFICMFWWKLFKLLGMVTELKRIMGISPFQRSVKLAELLPQNFVVLFHIWKTKNWRGGINSGAAPPLCFSYLISAIL